MGIQNWSTTAANNATAAPNIDMQTGSAPSTVHPSVRQLMADVATWYADAEWLVQSDVPTYVSATSFTVPGNRTATYSANRRIQAVGTTGAGYTLTGTIQSSTYTTLTTVTVTWDTGSLDSTVDQVAVGILQNQLANIQSILSSDYAPISGSTYYAPISGSTVYAPIAGSSSQTFAVSGAATSSEAVNLGQAQGLFAALNGSSSQPFNIAQATTSTEAIRLDQGSGVGGASTTGSGTSVPVSAAAFTPTTNCSILAFASAGTSSSAVSVSITATGATSVFAGSNYVTGMGVAIAVFKGTAGTPVTLTATASDSTSASLNVNLAYIQVAAS